MTVRSQLVSLVIAIAVPLVFFAAAAVYLVHTLEARTLRRGLRDTASAMALAVDREIDVSVSTLQALGASKHLEAGEFAEFYDELQRVRAVRHDWDSAFVADARGREILGLLVPLGTPLPDIGRDPEVIEVLRTGQPYVSNLRRGPVSGRPVLRVLVPVVGHDRVRYLLAATLDPTSLAQVLVGQPMSPGSLTTVLDREGTTIAGARHGAASVGRAAPDVLLEQTRRARDGVVSMTGADGDRVYVAFSRIPRLDFTVAVSVPASAIPGTWFWMVVVGTSVVLVGAVACAVVIACRIAEPIRTLARVALGWERRLPMLPADEVVKPADWLS